MNKSMWMALAAMFIVVGLSSAGEKGKDVAKKAGKSVSTAKITSKQAPLLQLAGKHEDTGIRLMGATPADSKTEIEGKIDARKLFQMGAEIDLVIAIFASPDWDSNMQTIARNAIEDIEKQAGVMKAPVELMEQIKGIYKNVDLSLLEKQKHSQDALALSNSLLEFIGNKLGDDGTASFSLGMLTITLKMNLIAGGELDKKLWNMMDEFRSYLMGKEQSPELKRVTSAMRAISNVLAEGTGKDLSDRKVLEKALQDIMDNYNV